MLNWTGRRHGGGRGPPEADEEPTFNDAVYGGLLSRRVYGVVVGYTARMVAAIRQRVVVRQGGVVEVRSAELRPGASAEVIVLVDAEDGRAPTRETDQVKAFDALQRSMELKPDAAAAWAAEARRERKATSRRRERRP